MTTTDPSTPEAKPRNPETRGIVNLWLDRMDDVEGTIHRNNGTVVLLISGKEIDPQAVDAPVESRD